VPQARLKQRISLELITFARCGYRPSYLKRHHLAAKKHQTPLQPFTTDIDVRADMHVVVNRIVRHFKPFNLKESDVRLVYKGVLLTDLERCVAQYNMRDGDKLLFIIAQSM
jgi:hypothetical protein